MTDVRLRPSGGSVLVDAEFVGLVTCSAFDKPMASPMISIDEIMKIIITVIMISIIMIIICNLY